MRRRIIWLVLLAIVAPAPAARAFAQEVSAFDRFQLFNECRPMRLTVERLPADAAEIDLTEAAIQAAVESRLRSARLYDADADPYLYVNVFVVGRAYAFDLEYKKVVYDQVSTELGFAATWKSGNVGTHGGGAAFILSNLAGHMDRFLVEYLRVNESACD